MPFAIHVYFDAASESLMRGVREELARCGVSYSNYGPTSRPHLSLALYDELDIAACVSRLKMFAEMFSPFALTISSLGIFPTGNACLFVAPTVTQRLLDVHAYIHQLLEDAGTASLTNFVPGSWIPYCSLAPAIDARFIPQAIAIGMAIPLPLYCRVEEIGVVECWPVKHLYSCSLGGG
jgi:hypothetical protein